MGATAVDSKTFVSRSAAGPLSLRPVITDNNVSAGDEYFDTTGGVWWKATLDGSNAKQWTAVSSGNGVQTGVTTLVTGTKTISTPTITASSRVFVTRQGAPGGGTAIGLLNVRAVTPGAPGSFIIEALSEAAQVVVAADVSTVVWMVVN